jgi:uracil-DNA glycosylase family 4
MSLPSSLDALHEAIRAHAGCGFAICENARNLVPGEGDPAAEVLLVGEAPGKVEDELGRPFVGRSGQLLDELLAAAGLGRGDVYITNVVKARPPGNRDPKAEEVAHHLPWLELQLALIAPAVIIPVGRHALARFAPGRKITEVHGGLIAAGDRRLVPWFHPAAGLRSTGVRELLFQDARALPGVLESARGLPSAGPPG